MAKEKWYAYSLDMLPNGRYEVVKILQDANGTFIKLESEEENKIIIKFNFVDALRVCDEGRRIVTYNETLAIQKYRENFFGNPIYYVENSELCKWLSLESAGFCVDVKHYVIITINHMIDIVTSEAPEIILDN